VLFSVESFMPPTRGEVRVEHKGRSPRAGVSGEGKVSRANRVPIKTACRINSLREITENAAFSEHRLIGIFIDNSVC